MFERKLKQVAEANGSKAVLECLNEALETKKVNLNNFSFRRLADSFLGDGWHEKLNRGRVLRESVEGIDSSLFASISGQILINEIKDKYRLAVDIAEELVTTIPVVNGNLGSQKVPWLSDVTFDPAGDNIVEQGMPFPQTQFASNYITYPNISKVGKICSLSAEAIYSDLTTQIIDSARSVGQYCGLAKSYQIYKMVLGLSNTHSWNGTNYNTYNTSGQWVNLVTGFSLVDWSSVNILEQLFVNMRDPNTNQPLMIEPKQMLVMPALKYQARTIINASSVSKGAFSPTADQIRGESANPLDKDYQIISSPFALKTLTDAGVSYSVANSKVFLGDFKSAFVWREAKPLTVVEAPPQYPSDFLQDYSLSIKASWWGAPGVRDPRYVVQGTIS